MTDRYAVVNPPEQGKRSHANNKFTQLINKINQRKKVTPR